MIEDIEGLTHIQDYSLYLDIAIIFLIMIIVKIISKLYKKIKNKKPTKEELALYQYKKIDFENPKKAAYLITKYGYILAKNEKSKDIFKELLKHLTKYKYKKNVEHFDKETIGLYNLFLEVVTNE